ncbi:hypothetical protein D3C80_1942010 [compost metagenome]
MGETEEHHRHQAAKAGERSCVALGIFQLEGTPKDLVAQVLTVLVGQLASTVATAEEAKAQQTHTCNHLSASQINTHLVPPFEWPDAPEICRGVSSSNCDMVSK